MNNPLIGAGFHAVAGNLDNRTSFLDGWLKNTLAVCNNVVVVLNAEARSDRLDTLLRESRCRVVDIRRNLGHVGGMLGQNRPKLLGWSMSWILPAFYAYCEGSDFFYKEQDCLAFGPWMDEIVAQAGQNRAMMFGTCRLMQCEQSLFWIKHDHILPAIESYLSYDAGDAVMLPEHKFIDMEKRHAWVSRHSLGVGRDRPMTFLEKAWYVQQITPGELMTLEANHFVC